MNNTIQSIARLLRDELERPEWRAEVLKPLTKRIAYGIFPYAFGIICLNFFMTIAAVSLVLYFYRR